MFEHELRCSSSEVPHFFGHKWSNVVVFRIILYIIYCIWYIDKLCDVNCFGKKGLDRSFKPGTKNIEWISYFLDDIWYNLDEVKSICMSSCVLGCVCLYLQTNQRSKLSPLTDMGWYSPHKRRTEGSDFPAHLRKDALLQFSAAQEKVCLFLFCFYCCRSSSIRQVICENPHLFSWQRCRTSR